MANRDRSVIILMPDNGRDDVLITLDHDSVQAGMLRIVPFAASADGTMVPDYTGVLREHELARRPDRGRYYYDGQLYEAPHDE